MWGQAGVSLKRELSNGISQWGPGGTVTLVDIQRIGILRKLRLLTKATATFTAGASLALDTIGPYNVYSALTLSPNQTAPIARLSGLGAYLAMQMKSEERKFNTPDFATGVPPNADGIADVFNAARTTTNGDWRLFHDIHVSQFIASLGCELGMWPLENPAVQLQLEYTPNSSTTSSPFSIDNKAAAGASGTRPYFGDVTSDVTLTTPTVDVRRRLWEVPADASDDPPYTYINQWLEEAPQGGNVNGTSFIEWKCIPLSGVILRAGIFVYDGGASLPVGAGVAESSLTAGNALTLLYGADTQKYAETGQAAHARMLDMLGYTPQKGFFFWNLMGGGLTLADVIDTYTTPEVRIDVNLSTPLGGSNSFARVIRQMLVPIEIRGR